MPPNTIHPSQGTRWSGPATRPVFAQVFVFKWEWPRVRPKKPANPKRMSIRLKPKAFFASTLIGLLSIMRHPLISFANMHPVHNQTNHHRQHHDHHDSSLLPIVVSDQQPRVAAFGCVLIRKQGLTRLDIMFIVVSSSSSPIIMVVTVIPVFIISWTSRISLPTDFLLPWVSAKVIWHYPSLLAPFSQKVPHCCAPGCSLSPRRRSRETLCGTELGLPVASCHLLFSGSFQY